MEGHRLSPLDLLSSQNWPEVPLKNSIKSLKTTGLDSFQLQKYESKRNLLQRNQILPKESNLIKQRIMLWAVIDEGMTKLAIQSDLSRVPYSLKFNDLYSIEA